MNSAPQARQDELANVYFIALKGKTYNSLRQVFFINCHRWFIAVSIILGSASIAYAIFPEAGNAVFLDYLSASLSNNDVAVLFSCTALIIGILGYILDFTGSAERHKILSHRWENLIERLDDKRIGQTNIKNDDYKQFVKDFNKITRSESPMFYNGLDAIAHNFASKAESYADILHIPWCVRVFKNFWRFSNREFKRVS